jgi:hypothetical protein
MEHVKQIGISVKILIQLVWYRVPLSNTGTTPNSKPQKSVELVTSLTDITKSSTAQQVSNETNFSKSRN